MSAQFYTRNDIASLVGVSDDVLSFWLKQGLLKPIDSAGGRGRHRRFDLHQINIAAVLGELRRFGVNVGLMRAVSTILQRGTALGVAAECNFWALNDAIELASGIERFKQGDPVIVSVEPKHQERANPDISIGELEAFYRAGERPAQSMAEILKDFLSRADELYDEPDKVAAFAQRLVPDDLLSVQLFIDLNHGAYRYRWEGRTTDWGNAEWLISTNADGPPEIFRSPEGHDLLGSGAGRVTSGLFLAPGTIFRNVWRDTLEPIVIDEPVRSAEFLARRRAVLANAAGRQPLFTTRATTH